MIPRAADRWHAPYILGIQVAILRQACHLSAALGMIYEAGSKLRGTSRLGLKAEGLGKTIEPLRVVIFDGRFDARPGRFDLLAFTL